MSSPFKEVLETRDDHLTQVRFLDFLWNIMFFILKPKRHLEDLWNPVLEGYSWKPCVKHAGMTTSQDSAVALSNTYKHSCCLLILEWKPCFVLFLRSPTTQHLLKIKQMNFSFAHCLLPFSSLAPAILQWGLGWKGVKMGAPGFPRQSTSSVALCVSKQDTRTAEIQKKQIPLSSEVVVFMHRIRQKWWWLLIQKAWGSHTYTLQFMKIESLPKSTGSALVWWCNVGGVSIRAPRWRPQVCLVEKMKEQMASGQMYWCTSV